MRRSPVHAGEPCLSSHWHLLGNCLVGDDAPLAKKSRTRDAVLASGAPMHAKSGRYCGVMDRTAVAGDNSSASWSFLHRFEVVLASIFFLTCSN
jgi:hypothetical protein